MHLVQLPFSTATEQLAADEALLEAAEAGESGEALLFWEPQETFVVVGYANKVSTEVNVAECTKRGVPIYRRCSGGGTIVQMPGGLNYSVILRIEENGPVQTITSANRYIMERNCAAIAAIDPARRFSVRGHTDLCVNDLKFAGNSQRRRKNFLLFHGTLLLDCNLAMVEELLLMPSLQPEYRAQRSHRDFITNLGLSAEVVKATLARAWGAEMEMEDLPVEKIRQLAQEKYATAEWNLKF
jgi:lipoate-protein ligase A